MKIFNYFDVEYAILTHDNIIKESGGQLDYLLLSDRLIIRFENIVVDVANNKIDKELLGKIIYSFMQGGDYPEYLKLEIYNALK